MGQGTRTTTLRNPWLVGLAVGGLLLAAGCTPANAPAAGAGWVRTAAVPLGFVNDPLTVKVGDAFLVIGGSSGEKGDPSAKNLTAGARFDANTGVWTSIAAAPVGLSQFDGHVVLAGVLYVLPTELKDEKKSASGGPWVCGRQGFYSYDLAANVWAGLDLPSGVCSLDPHGLVATGDAVVALSTGTRSSWGDDDPQWASIYPKAVDAVFDPATKAWRVAKAGARKQVFRWGTWTASGLLVAVEPLASQDAYTTSSPATPAVYSWDYRADSWKQLDRPGSESLDWKNWTGRIQDRSGPVYFQGGDLLAFDVSSGKFRRLGANCGAQGCEALSSQSVSYFGSGVSDLGVFTDGWTLSASEGSAEAAVRLRPATGETAVLTLPKSPDPERMALDSVAVAGGSGLALSCPISPRRLPEAKLVEDLGQPTAALTRKGNAGTGQPGAMIRVTLAAPEEPTTLAELAVRADGKWQYVDNASRPQQLAVQSVEYVHKQDMQPYCYLLRY